MGQSSVVPLQGATFGVRAYVEAPTAQGGMTVSMIHFCRLKACEGRVS